MPDNPISGLTAVVAPSDTDEIAVNQAGVTKKETRGQVVSTVTNALAAHMRAIPATHANKSIQYAMFQDMPQYSVFGRAGVGAGVPGAISPAAFNTVLACAAGGTAFQAVQYAMFQDMPQYSVHGRAGAGVGVSGAISPAGFDTVLACTAARGTAFGKVVEAWLDAAVQAQLVTNGDTHDHVGGDGASIPEAGLAAAVQAQLVTNGDTHDHVGGDGAALGVANLANGTEVITVPHTLYSGGVGVAFDMAAGVQTSGVAVFRCPQDYVSGGSVVFVGFALNTGNAYCTMSVHMGATGEAYNTHTTAVAPAAIPVVNGIWEQLVIVPIDAWLSAGDNVECPFRRDGNDPLDTLAAGLTPMIYFIYTANHGG